MKKRLLIAFALALMVPWAARAQSMQDYSLSASNVTYTSFANADSLLSYVNGDGGTDTVVLPFNFQLPYLLVQLISNSGFFFSTFP